MNLGELEFTANEVEREFGLRCDSGRRLTRSTVSDFTYNLNQRLKEKLERCPVVYGEPRYWSAKQFSTDAHQARIVCIEPLEPPDSMEQLIEDIAAIDPKFGDWQSIIIRARKLWKGGE